MVDVASSEGSGGGGGGPAPGGRKGRPSAPEGPAAGKAQRLPGRLARTMRTAVLGGRVGSRALGGALADVVRNRTDREAARRNRQLDSARRVVATMQELRGPLMKVGQLLSTHTEALPPSVAEVLQPLQQKAPPMSYATIKEVVEDDLGEPPESLFQDFTEQAVAAASLGQVHRGRLPDGTDVAVKIQYPGADGSVEGDLRNLKLGATLVKRLLADTFRNERLDVTPVAEELAEHIAQEVDYVREAYNAKILGRLFAGDEHILVPRVHDRFSGLRVVTYDWVQGDDLDAGLRHADVAVRERTVGQMLHLFWRQFLGAGLLHADPHPGNFKVLPDGRLGLLDYGCVKIFDEHFMTHFGSMVVGRLEGDLYRVRQAMIDLELVTDPSDEAQFEDMLKLSEFCSVGLTEDEAFDFGSFSYVDAARELMQHFLSRRTLPPSKKDFLFLTRVVVGYYEYFSRAKVRLNFHRIVRPYAVQGWRGRAFDIPAYDAD
jgi:predicted unusual protein kinase regulating ubiquinone biosynthesis (AarF/ABC1/UbiB family)